MLATQASQASLGMIPPHAFAVGVKVNDRDVTMRFLLTQVDETDTSDIHDIVDKLEMLLGNEVHVAQTSEVSDSPRISTHDGVRWTFLARR